VQAGFSAQGWKLEGGALERDSRIIIRLPVTGATWRRLTAEEMQSYDLDEAPSWVTEHYGAQPPAGTLWGVWRTHPKLVGRFLPEYPDDLQVFVHDGGPRITRNSPEAVWVRVVGLDGDVFRGQVLNQPHQLKSLRQGSEIKFIAAEGAQFPIMVTEKYLAERGSWNIHPCQKCGLAELFDAPSDLIRVVFPNAPATEQRIMFSAFCPLCGGVQVVKSREVSLDDEVAPAVGAATPQIPAPPTPSKRSWWQFWN
jgi:hypothetical protein